MHLLAAHIFYYPRMFIFQNTIEIKTGSDISSSFTIIFSPRPLSSLPFIHFTSSLHLPLLPLASLLLVFHFLLLTRSSLVNSFALPLSRDSLPMRSPNLSCRLVKSRYPRLLDLVARFPLRVDGVYELAHLYISLIKRGSQAQ